MKGFLFLFMMLFALVASTEMCCETCTDATTKKYYSIDTLFNRCGECCTVDHPCAEEGYTVYEKTETHGGMGITVTLDKYKKPE